MTIKIKVGDIYEDCAYHPVLCTESSGDDVAGYSLLDGSYPRSCSIIHCATRKLEPGQVAMKIKNRDRWLAAEEKWRRQEDATVYDDLLNEEIEVMEKNLQ